MKGNPVMKAKVVTGPTPQQKLMTLLGVKQLEGSLPLANDAHGKALALNAGEGAQAILDRVKASIAGRTFCQHREY